ncbi:hypothetical protein BDV96DRAFT_485620 [Lophiotrema nucula]|uniref:Uncharacterized protein n=1 Tax=Lophiotrema nucula TaxID=690887 RepID=A0A6A5ZMG3_9PLEO|nr:hypothetical protein BDV96DRAFT_485620 [Lophiotrema nucula]
MNFALALAADEEINGYAFRSQYPEVIPGPGLPSLESLNLTSSKLYNMPIPPLPPNPAFDPKCGPNDSAYTNVNDIIACMQYLYNIPKQRCVGEPNWKVATFCSAGAAKVTAQSIRSDGSVSICYDAAIAVNYIVDHCTRPDASCAGFQAANGNGELIIGGISASYPN